MLAMFNTVGVVRFRFDVVFYARVLAWMTVGMIVVGMQVFIDQIDCRFNRGIRFSNVRGSLFKCHTDFVVGFFGLLLLLSLHLYKNSIFGCLCLIEGYLKIGFII
uniref:Uncharacterized protein n=1 Tax=Cacopsylla melanoneura TaxID=428564 RepID=A0A8D8M559_9HEMI